MTRIVLAYPDTVWGREPHRFVPDPVHIDDAIAWLVEHHDAEVVALLLDFGQGRELEALRDRALAAGAVRAHVLDVADQFAARYVLPTLKAGALCLSGRPGAPGIARMACAEKLVEIAGIEHTNVVAHAYGATDHSLATAVHALDSTLTVIAVPQSVLGPSAARFQPVSGAGAGRSSEPATVDLTFARGVPTAINGVAMPLLDLMASLDMLRGASARRIDHRGTAAVVLHDAHRGLQESVAADQQERHTLAGRYADLIATGAWFSSERQALASAVDRLEKPVSGIVRLQLLNEDCRIVEIRPRTKVEVRK
jgi:argininosuccinate synthase